jgi:hypothetical protein
VDYNFQTGKNKIKLLMQYESVTQRVLLFVEPLLQKAKKTSTCAPFLARKQFYFFVSGLKIIGTETPT